MLAFLGAIGMGTPAVAQPVISPGADRPADLSPSAGIDGQNATGLSAGNALRVRDTVGPLPRQSDDPAVQQALARLAFEPAEFEVVVTPAPKRLGPLAVADPSSLPDAWVRYPSPFQTGDVQIDRVTVRWFQAQGVAPGGSAPAVVIAHSLHPGLVVGNAMARGLARRGVHGLVVELPGFGERRPAGVRYALTETVGRIPQGVADLRRARDVAAALPGVDPDRIGLAGVSLGGLFATLAGGLDGAFVRVELLSTGGQVARVLTEGAKDAYFAARALRAAGRTDAQIAATVNAMEPTVLAYRLAPTRTRLFAAADDQVFPMDSVRALAKAAGLSVETGGLVWIAGNHYTMAGAMPAVLDAMAQSLKNAENASAPATAQVEGVSTLQER
ncbi:MAG: alpha/beta hydrolase family protein [Planctomycetota bacterium]